MKNFYLLFLFILATVNTYSQGSLYFCGFNTNEEFEKWTKIRLDESENRDWRWNTERKCAMITSDATVSSSADSWLISPKINLSSGKEYTVKIKYGAEWANELMSMTIGKTNTPEGQTTIIKEWKDGELSNCTKYISYDIPDNIETGEYYIGFHNYSPAWSSYVYIYSFEICEKDNNTLTVNVTNSDSEKVDGAAITLSNETYEEFTINTNSEGTATFEYLSSGNYNLKVEKDGHETLTQSISIVKDNENTENINLRKYFRANVTGRVINENGEGVKDAYISVVGEVSYSTRSNDDGYFTIENVREYTEPYKITITKDLKKKYESTFNMTDSPVDLSDITLLTNVTNPCNIQTLETPNGLLISWSMRLQENEFRNDNDDIVYGIYQVNDAPKGACANKYNIPVTITSVKWVTSRYYGKEQINLRIYSLDKYGNITNNLLFSKDNINTVHFTDDETYQWNEYVLENEVEAPYGCLVAICGENIALMTSEGVGKYPSYISYDYENEGFIDEIKENSFLIRIKGYTMGEPQMAYNPRVKANEMKKAPGTMQYRLWRLTEDDMEWGEDYIEDWTVLQTNSSNMIYLDKNFFSLDPGNYYYALQAVFDDGKESEIIYTPAVECKMITNLDVYVETNTSIDLSENALVRITNKNNNQVIEQTVEKGKATFSNIQKGNYKIDIIQEGFKEENFEMELLSDTKESVTKLIELIPTAPQNAKVTIKDNNVTLSWNEEGYCIFDDFENMKDFEINPEGDNKWSYIDNDGSETYGLKICEDSPFENMYEKMAFIAFNSANTTPDHLTYIKPHSGNKVLLSIANSDQKQNDDYIFSPELNFENDFTFSFYAMAAYFASLGNELFKVGYTENNEISLDNIVWITEQPQEATEQWQKFSYKVPSSAKHVFINYMSQDKIGLAIDDIYIGYEPVITDAVAKYEVYLDEVSVGKVNKPLFEFNNLKENIYLAKVQTIYGLKNDQELYSSFTEIVIDMTASGISEEVENSNCYYYDSNNNTLYFKEIANKVSLYNMNGIELITAKDVTSIDLGNISSGVYIIKMENNNEVITEKMIIK